LHSHGVVFSQAQVVFEENNRAELADVVFDVESIFATLDDGVAARDGNIIDADLALVTPAEFELIFLVGNRKHVDISRSIFVEWH